MSPESINEPSMDEKLVCEEGRGEDAILLADYDHAGSSDSRNSTETSLCEQEVLLDNPAKKQWISRITPQFKRGLESLRCLPRLCLYLLPSFIYPWNPTAPPKTPHPTAYLDGLRGIAAVFVAIHHYTCQFTPAMLEGWGSGVNQQNIESNYWFFQLPFIRIVHSGQFMVVLFYVLSGCVLSARGLRLARDGKQKQFASTMASSVFRRWIRLHLPVAASIFIAFTISRFQGWAKLRHDWLKPPAAPAPEKPVGIRGFERVSSVVTRAVLDTRKAGFHRFKWDSAMAPKRASLMAQIWEMFTAIAEVSDPFQYGKVHNKVSKMYNPGRVLWTIPAEWLGSMVVFLVVLGLAWTSSRMRFGVILMITFWCHHTSRWEIASFLSGTLIAELMLIRNARIAARAAEALALRTTPADDECGIKPMKASKTKSLLSKYKDVLFNTFWIAMFLTGVFLGSQPYSYASKSLGFRTIFTWIPKWYNPAGRFYLCVGSIFVILPLTYCAILQRFFSTRFMRYLGRISFSLYLLHCQVSISLGIRVMSASMKFVGGGLTEFRFGMGLALGSLVLVPITVWASDLFCRVVDEQSVELARWLAERFLKFDK